MTTDNNDEPESFDPSQLPPPSAQHPSAPSGVFGAPPTMPTGPKYPPGEGYVPPPLRAAQEVADEPLVFDNNLKSFTVVEKSKQGQSAKALIALGAVLAVVVVGILVAVLVLPGSSSKNKTVVIPTLPQTAQLTACQDLARGEAAMKAANGIGQQMSSVAPADATYLNKYKTVVAQEDAQLKAAAAYYNAALPKTTNADAKVVVQKLYDYIQLMSNDTTAINATMSSITENTPPAQYQTTLKNQAEKLLTDTENTPEKPTDAQLQAASAMCPGV